MLQSMRDNSKGLISGILIGLLVIIFALSGAEALFSKNGKGKPVLTINGQDITETDVARAIQQQKQRMRQRFGDSVPQDMLSDENLRGPAIESLTQRTLLNQAAAKANMAVADKKLSSIITNISAFQGEDGKFDPQRYQQALRMLAYTPATYKAELTQDLTVQQLAGGISDSSFITDTELSYLSGLTNQTRDFSYATLSAKKLENKVSVSDEQVQQYYKAHAKRYTQPETITVEYIDLNVDSLMSKITVSDAELKKQYQQNMKNFKPVVKRHAAHILLESTEADKIAAVQKALKSGADFAALAKKYSEDLGSKNKGGDLGISTGDAFPKAFEAALDKLAVGEVSGPVKTPSGTHFIKLLDKSGGERPSFADKKADLAKQYKRTKAETKFVETLNRLEDLSYNAQSLASVGKELKLKVGHSSAFSRAGGTGIAAYKKVVKAAFSDEVLKNNNASDVVELAPDHVVVVKKIDHADSFVKPLAQVRKQVVATLRQQKAVALLAQKGKALQAQLRKGASLADLAKQDDTLAPKVVKNVTRNSREQPHAVIEHAFAMAKPTQTQKSVDGFAAQGEYTVIELAAVNTPSKKQSASQREAIRKGLRQLRGSADFAAFRQYLRQTADIEKAK